MGEIDPSASRTLLPELARSPGHLVWRASARVQLALAEVLPPGVDIHAYAAMLALGQEGALSQQAVADRISISRTTMAKIATDLVGRGLVERVRNPSDRRAYLLHLTPTGAKAARSWRRHAEDLEAFIGSPFTEAERAELRDLLHLVVEAELAPRTPEPLLDSIGFLITRAHFRMHRDFTTALAPLRIEPRHFGALTALRSAGPQPQAELARALGISGASVVQMVDDLARRGLIERRRLATDRRIQVLHLLPEAQAVLDQAQEIATGMLDIRLKPLTRKQVDRLVTLLGRFITTA
ncbi:MAG: MarR family transcriptional regulator [Actinomycetota bacterium]|nr:MarR family transcriptional regulator [Actinomycetota bacterium]